MAIGEAGQIITGSDTENEPITVNFTQPMDDPIIALTGTTVGGHPYSLRVIDVQSDSFTFIIEEWEYLDGAHPAVETINWIAVEEGVHTLPDGRTVIAGTTSADDGNTPVTFDTAFDPGTTPVVLTSVMSENDTTTVDSDPFNITNTGFQVSLQEEEGQDGTHAFETVGFIAIEPGGDGSSGSTSLDTTVTHNPEWIDLNATYTNPIVVADVQTVTGGNPERVVINGFDDDRIQVSLREETSADAELNHINETVGLVAFEQGLILCFTAGCQIATVRGTVNIADLCVGDLVITRDNGMQPIRWIGQKQVDDTRLQDNPELRPILILKDSLGPNLPDRDMTVSPQHRMLVSGSTAQRQFGVSEILVPAKGLWQGGLSQQKRSDQGVEYFHILFDQHEVIYCNGAPTESLHPGHLSKDGLDAKARAEVFTIFPELASSPDAYGPPVRRIATVSEARVYGNQLALAG